MAETAKLFENTFRQVNIALVNELEVITNSIGISVYEVLDAAATKPYGFMKFKPGLGVGGHCIPVDPYYLLSKLKSVGANAGLINLACDLNKKRPQMIVRKIEAFLESRSKAIKGSNLLLIGLGYKKNISDLRESPAIEILDLLINLGCNLKWHDPLVTSNHSQRDVQRELDLSPELLKNQDLCVILADHDLIDWDMVLNYSSFILDTRNKLLNCHSSMI